MEGGLRNMYYLTVGYPLGSDIVENRLVFQVSLRKQAVQLIPLEYRIWGRFLLGAYGEEVEKASLCAERLTEKLRRLVMESVAEPERQRDYRERLIRSHWITIGYEKGILRAELPFLLPHRKSKYTDYVYQPLFLAMEKWCGERGKEGLEVPAYKSS